MSAERRFDISMHHIPVTGGLGAAFLIAVLVVSMALRLPPLRWVLIAGLVVGVAVAVFLIWRRRTGLPPNPPPDTGVVLPVSRRRQE
jgi:hypothetical protein